MAERRRESSDEEGFGNELSSGFAEIFEVEVNYAGWRLDLYLGQKLKRASRSQIVRFIRNGGHFADGRAARPASRVRPGDTIILPRNEVSDPDTPHPSTTRILHRDDTIVIVDKPAGLLVHRTASEATRTVAVFLQSEFGDLRIEPVHRLDRDTSGCLVCAIGEQPISTLRSMFADLEISKVYAALVRDPEGVWQVGDARTFDEPLGFDEQSPVAIRVARGQWSCSTHAECLARNGSRALLRVAITQGRQHQIRAHLSLFGTPLVGDKLYAMGDPFFLRWIDAPGSPELVDQLDARWHALHAWRVRFDYGGRSYDVEAPLPERLRP